MAGGTGSAPRAPTAPAAAAPGVGTGHSPRTGAPVRAGAPVAVREGLLRGGGPPAGRDSSPGPGTMGTGGAPMRAHTPWEAGVRAAAARDPGSGPDARGGGPVSAVRDAGSERDERPASLAGPGGDITGVALEPREPARALTERTLPEPVPVDGPAAFGAPGGPATWAPGAKQAVGTALSERSPVWFTIAEGVVTEVFYPRVDLANTRDLQLLLVGRGPDEFFEERRDTLSEVRLLDPRSLAWRVTNAERQGRFVIDKRVITDPGRPALVVRAAVRAGPGGPESDAPAGDRARDGTSAAAPHGLTPYVLLAPHVGDRGTGNTATVVRLGERLLLHAHRHDTHLALACSLPLRRASAGYVGASDGWTDLRQHRETAWRFARADHGCVALVAELAGDVSRPFSLALGFGRSAAEACAHAVAAADADFEALLAAYVDGWHAYCDSLQDLSRASRDGGRLYWLSAMVIRAHEDRQNPGAHIASLAVPWGEAQGDKNRAGYHLVWPRDLYQAATARLAAGDADGALRALHYLQRTQREDGSWPQNFWVFGEPYWHGLQLDEIAFPVLLAWQLRRADALDWNPYPSVVAPAAYRIARVGPVTQQERWEENSGYSPSTLAVAIAALVCAAELARDERDPQAARYFLEVADYWAAHLEDWTYTRQGCIPGHPELTEYYERIVGSLPEDPAQLGRGLLLLANRPPGAEVVPECAVIDGGFLELVRYGVRRPDDPRVLHTLRAYDTVCRVETPCGPSWRRYTFDGYGQQADGRPFDGTGVGRAWPLLTGERAHYELAAGGRPLDLVQAMERFTTSGGMLPEQVWDSPDVPDRGMFLGRPTGSAAPLVWAHAEYVKLLRSLIDGAVFDCPPPVRQRYARAQAPRSPLVIWKHNHKVRTVPPGLRLRIEVYAPAALHWTADGWRHVRHDPMEPYGHGVWIYDFPAGAFAAGTTLQFTFFWNERQAWEGCDHAVTLR